MGNPGAASIALVKRYLPGSKIPLITRRVIEMLRGVCFYEKVKTEQRN